MKIPQFLKTIDGLADNTKRAYEQTLWQLNSVIEGHEPSELEILAFLKRYHPSSLHRHKAAIKAYLECQGKDWPFTRRQFTQRHRRVLRYVQPEVIQQIEKVGDMNDYQYVHTLFILGCRISELMGITAESITPHGVVVVNKGGWERMIPLTPDAREQLIEFSKGKKGRLFPRHYTYYRNRLKELATRVGHPEVTPHMVRHSRAVDLHYRKGMALDTLRQFLGHAQLSTTAIYTEITGGELAEELIKVEGGE